jgi:hypothetical protein
MGRGVCGDLEKSTNLRGGFQFAEISVPHMDISAKLAAGCRFVGISRSAPSLFDSPPF